MSGRNLSSKVSIIIVNFKNVRDTIECLSTLFSSIEDKKQYYNVIIVDNESANGSDFVLHSAFPTATVLSLQRNAGFAGANNVGILTALKGKPDYIFLLNNDALVNQQTIEQMLEVFKKDPAIGIVGATILEYVNPKAIDNMGAEISYLTGSSKFIANGELYRRDREDIDVDYSCGAAMMIKREVIENVGLLPEFYFLYGEEKEFCVLAKNKKYRVVNSAKATVIHKTSSTVRKYRGLKNYYFHRNRFIFLRLHAKPHQYIFAILHSFLLLFPIYVFRYILQDKSRPHDRLCELYSFAIGIIDGIRCKSGYTREVK